MQGELATIAFAYNESIFGENTLFSQRREDGSWEEAEFVVPEAYAAIPPVMVALDPSPHLLLVYAGAGGRALRSVYHDGSRWSNPKDVADAVAETVEESDFQFSLAALEGDRAILAYRALGRVRVAHFDGESWSIDPAINSLIRGIPAVARGIDGFDAELVYVGTDGRLMHARLNGGSWTQADEIDGMSNLAVNIALTSVP
jgi:hypothetical protein